jgi:hypothetical protein
VRAIGTAVLATTLALLGLSLTPRPASGESLAEIAARERARRKGSTEGVIGDDALRNAARRRAATGEAGQGQEGAASTTSSTQGQAASAGKSEEDLRAERAKEWRERNTKATEEVSRLEDEIAKIQAALGDMRAYQYGPNRAEQVRRLEEAQAALKAAQERVEELEEERRREGFAE